MSNMAADIVAQVTPETEVDPHARDLDLEDENTLRKLWQECEDPEEKRRLRSVMYRLREERLKAHYGQKEVIQDILNPLSEEESHTEKESILGQTHASAPNETDIPQDSNKESEGVVITEIEDTESPNEPEMEKLVATDIKPTKPVHANEQDDNTNIDSIVAAEGKISSVDGVDTKTENVNTTGYKEEIEQVANEDKSVPNVARKTEDSAAGSPPEESRRKRSTSRTKSDELKSEKSASKSKPIKEASIKRKVPLDHGKTAQRREVNKTSSTGGDETGPRDRKNQEEKLKLVPKKQSKKSPEREYKTQRLCSRESSPTQNIKSSRSPSRSKSPETASKKASVPLKSALKKGKNNSDDLIEGKKKDNHEDTIIKELDNLDKFLKTQRSISQDDSSKKKDSESSDVLKEGKKDVMKTGEEKPFEKKIYKYDCPVEDEKHHHYIHPDKRVKKDSSETKRRTPDRSISEIENEIISGVIEKKLGKKSSIKEINMTRSKTSQERKSPPRKASIGSVEAEPMIKSNKAVSLGKAKRVSTERKDSSEIKEQSKSEDTVTAKNGTSLMKKVEKFSPSSASRLAKSKQRDQDKEYEEDILSRPSVFDKPKEKKIIMKKIRATDETTDEIPKKSTSNRYSRRRSSEQKIESEIRKVEEYKTNNDTKTSKVLTSKNMKEMETHLIEDKNKEEESKSITKSCKVSKRTAFFEARARGEKQSVESLTSLSTDNKLEELLKPPSTESQHQPTVPVDKNGNELHTTTSNSAMEREKNEPTEASCKKLKRADPPRIGSPPKERPKQNTNKTNKTTNLITSSSKGEKTTTHTLNIDSIDSIPELEKLLENSSDYGERSKLRARIRILKRQSRLKSHNDNQHTIIEQRRRSSGELKSVGKRIKTSPSKDSNKSKGKVATSDLNELDNKENKLITTGSKGQVKCGARRQSWESRESAATKKTHRSYGRKHQSDTSFSTTEKAKSGCLGDKQTTGESNKRETRNSGKRVKEDFGVTKEESIKKINENNKTDRQFNQKRSISDSAKNKSEIGKQSSEKKMERKVSRDFGYDADKKSSSRDVLSSQREISSTDKEGWLKNMDSSRTAEVENEIDGAAPREVRSYGRKGISGELFSTRHVDGRTASGDSILKEKREEDISSNEKKRASVDTDGIETKAKPLSLSSKSKTVSRQPKTWSTKDSRYGRDRDPKETASDFTSAVTSSYGVGPTDDQGVPLFGLKALRRVKQAQEEMASKSEASAATEVPAKPETPPTSFPIGLKALKGYKEPTPKPKEEKTVTNKKPDWVNPKPPVVTKSFTKVRDECRKITAEVRASKEMAKSDSATADDRVSETRVYRAAVKPDESTTESTSPFSRGMVGRSSVKELSKRFEAACTKTKVEESPFSTNKRNVSSTSKCYETQEGTTSCISTFESLNAGSQVFKAEGEKRSFLNTKTPVENTADLLDRMKGGEHFKEDGNETDLSLLNKFIGAHSLLQGIEPLLTGKRGGGVVESERQLLARMEEQAKRDDKEGSCDAQAKEESPEKEVTSESQESTGDTATKALESLDLTDDKPETEDKEIVSETTPAESTLTSVAANPADSKATGECTELLVEFIGASETCDSKENLGDNIESNCTVDTTTDITNQNTDGDSVEIEEMSSNEETLFDSGTESGEDSVTAGDSFQTPSGSTSSMGILKQHDTVMDALQNAKSNANPSSFAYYGDGKMFASSPMTNAFPVMQQNVGPHNVDPNAELAHKIDSALALLRESVARDPTFVTERLQAVTGSFAGGISNEGKGKELIALIDRLKSTLNENENSSVSAGQPVIGTTTTFQPIGTSAFTPYPSTEGLPKKEMATLDFAPDIDDSCVPWKVRKARKKSKTRSHTVGVSEEELAEARRYIEENERRQFPIESQSVVTPETPRVRKNSMGSISNTTSPIFSPITTSSPERKLFPVTPRPFKSSAEIFESLRQAHDAGSLSDGGGLSGYSPVKLRALRTVSLDSSYDPSKNFFTPEENIQIAIHKAAIKKQVSAEEDRRSQNNRRNSFSSISAGRDLSLRLPKPFCPPKNKSEVGEKDTSSPISDTNITMDSGTPPRLQATTNSEVKQYSPPVLSHTGGQGEPSSPQSSRFENVQISLKELNTSEYPQLQIAITLKNNNNGGSKDGSTGSANNNNSGSSISNVVVTPMDSSPNNSQPEDMTILKRQSISRDSNVNAGDSGISSTQPFTGSSDEQCKMDTCETAPSIPYSSKIGRYKSKSERKKRMKRANTIDIPQPPGLTGYNNEDSEMEDEDSEGYATPTAQMSSQFATNSSKPVYRPAFLGAGDRWTNKFSNLKCSFESSSQGSSPSISPLPAAGGKRPVSESNLAALQQDSGSSNKPVWATSQKLPSQVKNKLQIFEDRNGDGAQILPVPIPLPPRRPEPTKVPVAVCGKTAFPVMAQENYGQTTEQYGAPKESKMVSSNAPKETKDRRGYFPPPGNNMASTVPPKMLSVDNYSSDSESFGPRKIFRGANSDTEGKRTVHTVANMFNKKDADVPPPLPPRTHQLPPPPPTEKIELPWAKKQESEDSKRVLLSKSKFEQNLPFVQQPMVSTGRPQSAFIPDYRSSQNSLHDEVSSPFIRYDKNFDMARMNAVAKKPMVSTKGSVDMEQQGRTPKKLNSTAFGITRSLDDSFTQPKKQFMGHKMTMSNESLPTKPVGEPRKILKGYKISTGIPMAFTAEPQPPSGVKSEVSPPKSFPTEEGCSPVVSKVMKGPQKQTAMVTTRVSSLGEEPVENKLATARSNIRNILNQYNSDDTGSGDSTGDLPSVVSGNFRLPPLSKSQSGGSVLSQVQAFSERAKENPVVPLPSAGTQLKTHPVVKDGSDSKIQQNTKVPVSSSTLNSHIPRQKSLSEFPRIAPAAPVLKTLTVNTSMKPPGQNLMQKRIFENVPVKDEEEEFESDLDRHTKPYRAFARSEQLKRSSSGSTIFNRAQSLYLSAQENIRPVQPERVKPTVPRTQKLFPKQFEAQMSPSSANKKQREIEAYFKAQQVEQEKKQEKESGKGKRGGTHLRKSASLGRLMHRQMSISDGDDDVDQVFESLFKASGIPEQRTLASSVTVTHKKVTSSMALPPGNSKGIVSPFNKFKQMDENTNAKKGGPPLFKFTSNELKQSATSAKDILLYWCQCRTRDYQNVKIENFSSSWSDGLAFCALIHHFFPDAFDYSQLDSKNRKRNFDLAFKVAFEKAEIYPLLETEDMLAMGRRPDWKCVFTYVQSMYQKLKDL